MLKRKTYLPPVHSFRRAIIDFTIPSGSFFKYLADMKSIMECTGSVVRSTSEGIAIQFDEVCEIMS